MGLKSPCVSCCLLQGIEILASDCVWKRIENRVTTSFRNVDEKKRESKSKKKNRSEMLSHFTADFRLHSSLNKCRKRKAEKNLGLINLEFVKSYFPEFFPLNRFFPVFFPFTLSICLFYSCSDDIVVNYYLCSRFWNAREIFLLIIRYCNDIFLLFSPFYPNNSCLITSIHCVSFAFSVSVCFYISLGHRRHYDCVSHLCRQPTSAIIQ